MAGCSTHRDNTRPADVLDALINSELIYEETFSPNGAYTEQEENKVYNTVRIYQNDENRITVIASSNSLLFDGLQYKYECDKKIASSDVDIKWLALMGHENPTKENQLMVADISVSVDGEIRSERKINFGKKAMEIITEIQSKTIKNRLSPISLP